MASPFDERILELLHHRARHLAKGEPVALPITGATTFLLPGEPDAEFTYARGGTPTVAALEAELGVLEDAKVICFASGMAAVAAALFASVGAGDRLLIPSDGYYNTRKLSAGFLAGLGVEVVEMPTREMGGADLSGFACVMVETPSNPALDLCDLTDVAERAKAAGAVTIADNTTASPLGQRPLDLGFDLVVCADTKAIGGHSDVLAGHVAGRDAERMQRVWEWNNLAGAALSPFDAFLVHRGLASFEVRWERMCANAGKLAEGLEREGLKVSYPGLASHPHHALARKQMRRFGSVLGVEFADAETANAFIARCPVLIPATSFGGVHASAERRARWGDQVGEGYVRISCGVEPTEAFVKSVLAAL